MSGPVARKELSARLLAFLEARLENAVTLENLKQFSVGFSWLTYGFDLLHDGQRQSLILRLAPKEGILPRYVAEPEAALLDTIAPSGLPVPRALFASDRPDAFGAPFLICTRCSGQPFLLSRKAIAEQPDKLRSLACQFIDHLAGLHRIAWQDGPYAAHARSITADSAALAEVEYWWSSYRTACMRTDPAMEWVYHWLVRHAPTAPKLAIVHGDYRAGNFLTDGDDITGILDFEMSHPGDPHDDLAYALLPEFNAMTNKVFGVLDMDEAIARYADASGVRVNRDTLHYYGVLARFKFAVICFWGLWKFRSGASADARMNFMGSQRASAVEALLEMTEAA